MKCPHCHMAIGGVAFRCPQCGEDRHEDQFRTAAGDRAIWCVSCRLAKNVKVTAARAARIDADKNAKALTQIIAHFPADATIVGHSKVIDYEIRDTETKEGDS